MVDKNTGISIIIRNKNEAIALEKLLKIITTNYSQDVDEIIVVDNYSTDNSKEIAKKYNAKTVYIKDFTYGRGINIGAENSKYEYCVLLSSHVLPIGNDFFKNIPYYFDKYTNAAGLRFCRNISDANNFYQNKTSNDDLNKSGLLASGSVFKKSIWQQIKFDEYLVAAEDKDWSKKVSEQLNKKIYTIPSVYFYINTRSWKQEAYKYKIEKIAHFKILNELEKQPFKKYIKELYRAVINFKRRLQLVTSRFYTDITFKKH